MSGHISDRVLRGRQLLERQGIDAVIATSTANVYYFTGKWLNPHERLLTFVLRRSDDALILAPEMHRQDFANSPMETIFWSDGEDEMALLARILPERGTISIDDAWPSHNLIKLIGLRPDVTMIDSRQTLKVLRRIKDSHEIDLLRKAGAAADRVMQKLIHLVRPGVRERELVESVAALWSDEGIFDTYEPIIGAGANSALPHHHSDDTLITSWNMVVMDMGCVVDHYYSDMTRTVAVSNATSQMKDVYEVVRNAQATGEKFVRPGILLGEVDRRTRAVIDAAGYGDYFIHRTGHGLGLEIHEEPYVVAGNDLVLQVGMVITIEPGIYLPGQFGVRIEDTVVVTETGCESLNPSSKELILAGPT